MTDELGEYLAYLDRADPETLRRRMAEFDERREEFNGHELITDIFMPEDGSPAVFPLFAPDPLPVGTLFWRGRGVDSFAEIESEAGLWEPPAARTGPGRLNTSGRPLLYTTWDGPLGVEEEARISDGQLYVLPRFKSVAPVRTLSLRQRDASRRMSVSQLATHQLISRFIAAQMFRPSNMPNAHRISFAFLRDVYDLPAELFDGWIWDSVESSGSVNIALRPEAAHRILVLDRLFFCRWDHGRRTRLGAADMGRWADRSQPPPGLP